MIDKRTILERIAKIKDELWRKSGNERIIKNVQGSLQSTISVLALIYGNPSPQLQRFLERTRSGASKADSREDLYQNRLATDIDHVLDSAIGDLTFNRKS